MLVSRVPCGLGVRLVRAGSPRIGTRLTVDATDAPGVLSRLGSITAKHQANIQHLAVYRGEGDRSMVVVGVNTLNTDEIEQDLAAEGLVVLYKLQNI